MCPTQTIKVSRRSGSRRLLAAALGVLLATATTPARAQQLSIGPQISGLGIGASGEVEAGVFSVAAEFGFIPVPSIDIDGGDYSYSVDPKGRGGLFTANVKIPGSRFCVGAGLLIGGYRAEGEAIDLGDEIELGGGVYPATDVGTLVGVFELEGPAPALMLGLRGTGFNFGIGVAFTGTPDTELSATGPIRNDAQFRADLAFEKSQVDDDIDKLSVLPLLRLGWQFGI